MHFYKKKSCNFSGHKKSRILLRQQKSGNPLVQQTKNQATPRDKKKSCNLSGGKSQNPLRPTKVWQPLGTKKSRNLLGQKKATSWDNTNQAAYQDKKKSINLLRQKKSCNLLGQQKIMQPLRTKNHATYWDKKTHTNF